MNLKGIVVFNDAMSMEERLSNHELRSGRKYETGRTGFSSFPQNVTLKAWTPERAVEELRRDLRAEPYQFEKYSSNSNQFLSRNPWKEKITRCETSLNKNVKAVSFRRKGHIASDN